MKGVSPGLKDLMTDQVRSSSFLSIKWKSFLAIVTSLLLVAAIFLWLFDNSLELAIPATVMVVVFSFVFLAASFYHSRQIARISQILPLLGQQQFTEARSLLKGNKRSFLPDEIGHLDDVITSLSYQLESLEKNVALRTREMERLSLFDSLTGLANRNLFQYEVETDLENLHLRNGLLAIAILDLDNFKRINDSVGHHLGDVLLGKIALRIKSATRNLGLIARLGGDEFALILRGMKTPAEIEFHCQKILKLILKPIDLNGQQVVVSCSLGVAIATKSQSFNDVLKNAEIAMYAAKSHVGNTFKLFDNAMANAAHANLSMEADIRRALLKKEFTLFLQPKLNMHNQVRGFESLARWQHPERGIVEPAEFIPAMEELGLIKQLDKYILEESCQQLVLLQDQNPDISIAVNISLSHFSNASFLAFLKTCLQKYTFDPSRLELEITETLLMENLNAGMEVINQIKQLGVSIAIDDFGTGYSSLSYLKNLPVDTIKIDREFIKDIPDSESDMQISSVIIFLAKQLEFIVVAEGVETEQQLDFLKANQCDLAQGLFFSEPLPAEQAMSYLFNFETNASQKKDNNFSGQFRSNTYASFSENDPEKNENAPASTASSYRN
ncbi:hypothetical protein NBRC116493_32940 [Aurantivibrio infirmus]